MSFTKAVRRHMRDAAPMTRAQCLSLIPIHHQLANAEEVPAEARDCHLAWAAALRRRAGTPPGDAQPGDTCGLINDGAICDGTLECWVDVRGRHPDCACHISPPCRDCMEAPLVCNACGEEVT